MSMSEEEKIAKAYHDAQEAKLQGTHQRKGVPLRWDKLTEADRQFEIDIVKELLADGVISIGSFTKEEDAAALPLPGAVREGSVWCWEPLKAHAHEMVRVERTEVRNGEWWVCLKATRINDRPHWVEFDRFVEAAVLTIPGPQ